MGLARLRQLYAPKPNNRHGVRAALQRRATIVRSWSDKTLMPMPKNDLDDIPARGNRSLYEGRPLVFEGVANTRFIACLRVLDALFHGRRILHHQGSP